MFSYENIQLLKGIEPGDIVTIKYPSGNWHSSRVHSFINNELCGCAMQWDNAITEKLNIADGKVIKVTIDKKGREKFSNS